MQVVIEYWGRALPFKRVMTRGKRRYNAPEYTTYKEVLAHLGKIAMHGREPLQGSLKLTLKVSKRRRKAWGRGFGDLDNFLKAVMDALEGVCYADDSQVVEVTASKCTGEDKVEIKLEGQVN